MGPDGMLDLGDLARGARTLVRKRRAIRETFRVLGLDGAEPLSIGSLVERNAARYPLHPAVKHAGGVLSHRDLNRRANRIARHLFDRGVRKGDVVAVLLENRPELLVVVTAVVKLGAVAGMLNTNQRRTVLARSIERCAPKLCIVGEELVDAFDEVRSDLAGPAGALEDGSLYFVADAGVRDVPSGYRDLDGAVRDSPELNPPTTSKVLLEDPAFHIFTSGTTGLPKAAIMSHKRWVRAAHAFGLACLDVGPGDTVYAPLPLYHNQALTVGWGSATRGGAALAIRRKFSASAFWDDCRDHGATIMVYIGEIARYLLNQPPTPRDRDHTVRKAVGAGMRADVWMDFKRRFGVEEIYEFYGASEMNVAFVNMMNLDRTAGFCPEPYAIVEFDVDAGEPVRNEKGRLTRVKKGETGLLVSKVSERYGFEGYTDARESEKKLLRDVFRPGDAWYDSGDLVRSLGFRHVQFVDRVGDTFRYKSENVSTSEVELALNAIDGVAESTVYGVAIPGAMGRAGMAALVPAPGAGLDVPALAPRLRRELPAYAVPVLVRITDTLETTGTFKHRKVELRKQGYDPSATGDPIYVLLPGADRYVRLTGAIFAEIRKREHRF